MTEYVLSIDPGISNGVALLSFDPDSPAELVKAWQFPGGVQGLIEWLNEHWDGEFWDSYNDQPNTRGFYHWKMGVGSDRLEVDSHTEYNYESDNEDDWETEVPGNTAVITEKFTARSTQGFSYTTASLEPLRGEGALIALGLMPDYQPRSKVWRDPKYQYLVGGKDKADKKKRLHKFLKDSGFYVTGGMLGEPNADDARSAIGHGLAYIARELKHRPTWGLISSWEN